MGEPLKKHPCISCGACCAHYRVSFHWREAEANPDDPLDKSTPVELTEDIDPDRRSMKGTTSKHHSHCIALHGEIGKQVACGIYEWRPSPCRNFTASFENGYHNPRCDEARKKYGLKPLVKADYPDEYRKKIVNIDGDLST